MCIDIIWISFTIYNYSHRWLTHLYRILFSTYFLFSGWISSRCAMPITLSINIFKSLNKSDTIVASKWFWNRRDQPILFLVLCKISGCIPCSHICTWFLLSQFEIVLLMALNGNGIEKESEEMSQKGRVWVKRCTADGACMQKAKYALKSAIYSL